jgi:hypothetical protein
VTLRRRPPQRFSGDDDLLLCNSIIAGFDTASLPDLRRIMLRNSGRLELRCNPSLSQKLFAKYLVQNGVRILRGTGSWPCYCYTETN